MSAATATGSDESRGQRIGRWLMILFYGFAGVMHLAAAPTFVRIVPGWVPQPWAVVIATGLCELAGAAGLMRTRWRKAAGWGLAAYALCVWPANVKHAIDSHFHPAWYHYPRLALQPAIIWWALWAGGVTRWPFGPRRLSRSDAGR